MRSQLEVDAAWALLDEGLTTLEVSRLTGIPRSTIRYWLAHGRRRDPDPHSPPCGIDLGQFDASMYAYLLGMYLGDGCISYHRSGGYRLRIFVDSRQPLIARECAAAIKAVVPPKEPLIYKRRDSQCLEISRYWKHWPCVFPQHGAGRKHQRPIVLTPQQREIVFRCPRPFLRGLIHSDGTRIIATERKRNNIRRAARYAFSNRSEDILGLFAEACETVGVRYTRPSVKQIAIYRKASVALLDEFIGPKA